MITVYFENDTVSTKVATFESEEDYNVLVSVLEVMAKEAGYSRVTESVE